MVASIRWRTTFPTCESRPAINGSRLRLPICRCRRLLRQHRHRDGFLRAIAIGRGKHLAHADAVDLEVLDVEGGVGVREGGTLGACHGVLADEVQRVEGLRPERQPVHVCDDEGDTGVSLFREPNHLFAYVESGDLRLLAVFGDQKIANYPKVPTLKDLGYDFSVNAGLGLVGPKGLPEDIVKKLEASFLKATKNADFKKLLDRLDLLQVNRNRTELANFLKADRQQKRDLIKDLKLGIYAK